MSKYSIEESTLAGIADKVRTLRGTTGLIDTEQIATEIQAEANSGKVKLEYVTVTLHSYHVIGPYDVHYTGENGYATITLPKVLGQSQAIKVLKNSIIFADGAPLVINTVYDWESPFVLAQISYNLNIIKATQDLDIWVNGEPI